MCNILLYPARFCWSQFYIKTCLILLLIQYLQKYGILRRWHITILLNKIQVQLSLLESYRILDTLLFAEIWLKQSSSAHSWTRHKKLSNLVSNGKCKPEDRLYWFKALSKQSTVCLAYLLKISFLVPASLKGLIYLQIIFQLILSCSHKQCLASSRDYTTICTLLLSAAKIHLKPVERHRSCQMHLVKRRSKVRWGVATSLEISLTELPHTQHTDLLDTQSLYVLIQQTALCGTGNLLFLCQNIWEWKTIPMFRLVHVFVTVKAVAHQCVDAWTLHSLVKHSLP